MAVIASSSSSSSDAPCSGKYDVFISFRGEDTRNSFTSHLYAAFCRKKIKAYIDEYSLEKGDQISHALLKAIQESKLSVVIFSKDYASSTWCLDELVHILKCNKERGQSVVPVFYGVDPSHIRKQKEDYAAAFVAHEERFKDNMEKVKGWRDALTAAANISGFDSGDGSESKLIEMIVECTLKKLNRIPSTVNDFKDLVGMDKRVEEVENLLLVGSSSVRTVGIWGMGGIGKTTLANVIFNRLIHQFEGGCFLANVKEESIKQGLISLQKKLLVELLEDDDQRSDTPLFRSTFFRERLHRKRVLIVIDDVDSSEQVEYLIGDGIQFGVGSKILVTTRDSQVLRKRADVIYTLGGLDFDEALELFYLNAFKSNSSKANYIELSKRVVTYTEGNPLALKVLGSFLHSRTKEEWESALNKLEMIPHPDILKVLRISYDGLDDVEKDIFLDIACFFKGEKRNFVEQILEGCGFFPTIGIKVLIDKSLITIKDRSEIWMHDLVQEVGWEIVREESTKDPGKRSRLWIAQDVCHVLKNKRATEALEGIYLDMSKIDEEIHLRATAFKKMYNLRLLKIYNSNNNERKVHIGPSFQFFPSSLRYLSWYKYPSKSLPSKFEPRNLIELDMRHSDLKQLWNGVQNFGNLKHINLGYSEQLIKVPDLSKAPKLESINVEYCPNLLEFPRVNFQVFYEHECHVYCHYSDGRHLGSLRLDGCTKLKTFPEIHGNIKYLDLRRTAMEELPSSIGCYENLIILRLSDCLSLKNLPNLSRNIEILDLCGMAIEELPSSIGCLHHLRKINLNRCKRLKSLPANICKLRSLRQLDISDCSRLKHFSETLSAEGMRTDEELASGKIFGLRTLFLGGCIELEYVPYNWFYDLSSLETLLLDGCWKFEHFQTRLLCLYSLTQLHLRCCNVLEIPDWLGLLSSLTELHLGGNPFGSIPSTIKQLRQLTTLELRNCINLRSLPELPFSMRFLNASGCTSLETLSNSGDARAVLRNQMQEDVHKFLFCNCLKLDRSARDNFNDILCAVALMQGYPKFIAYCPGNNISNWFNYQSEGSSITFKLPSNKWPLSNNFLGFATCFVVASEAIYSDPYQCLTVECDLHFKTIHGQILEELDNFLGWNFTTVDFVDDVGSKIVSSDHVFISFSRYEADEASNKEMFGSYFDGIEASFRFQAFIDGWQNDHMDFEVKRCGVRMLYSEEPNQEFCVTTDEYGLDTIDYSRPNNRGTSTSHAIIDFDVHQPHPKRSRIF